MNIAPKAGPSILQPTGAKSSVAQEARQRAVEMIQAQSQSQPQPVPNANQISPEEQGAIRNIGQKDTSVVEQAQPVASEATPAPAEDPSKAEESLSSRYANLARKEKQLRLREQQLKMQERANKPVPAPTPEAPKQDLSKFIDKERLVKEPFAVLNELGLGYEELTNLALNAPSAQDLQRDAYVRKLEAKLNELESNTKSVQQKMEEQQTNARTQTIKQIHSEVRNLVSQDPAFETIKTTGSVKDVVDLIVKTYDEDGIIMSAEEAAREVEEYISNQLYSYATKINKVKAKLQPAPAQSAPQQPQTNPQQPQLKTLTNSMSTARQLSAKQRAILAFQGKLDK